MFLRKTTGHVTRTTLSGISSTDELTSSLKTTFSGCTTTPDATGSAPLFVGDKVWPLGYDLKTGASAIIQNLIFLPNGICERIVIITEDKTTLQIEPWNVVKYEAKHNVRGILFPLVASSFLVFIFLVLMTGYEIHPRASLTLFVCSNRRLLAVSRCCSGGFR